MAMKNTRTTKEVERLSGSQYMGDNQTESDTNELQASGSADIRQEIRQEMAEMMDQKFRAAMQELRETLMQSSTSSAKRTGKARESHEHDGSGSEHVMSREGSPQGSLRGSREGSRQDSPANSQATTMSTIHENEIVKELIKLIPRYDGQGSVQKLIEYVEGFQRYSDAACDNISTQTELTLATAKFSGDASLWWRGHRQAIPVTDPRRIRPWETQKLETSSRGRLF